MTICTPADRESRGMFSPTNPAVNCDHAELLLEEMPTKFVAGPEIKRRARRSPLPTPAYPPVAAAPLVERHALGRDQHPDGFSCRVNYHDVERGSIIPGSM